MAGFQVTAEGPAAPKLWAPSEISIGDPSYLRGEPYDRN
jgi:hypothetical protein